MTRIGMAGAEVGAVAADPVVIGGTVAIVSTPARTGTGAYSLASGGSNYLRFNFTRTPSRWTYGRCWIRLTAFPATATPIAMVHDGTTILHNIYIRANGTLSRLTPTGSVSAPIPTNEWHCLEIAAWGDTATEYRLIARLDGVQFDDFTNPSPSNAPDSMRFGWPAGGGAGTIYLDDLAFNDDTGTDQNSWPGVNGAIVLLKPASDQAVGADWKLGTGTTPSANAFDALNNVPPVGVTNGAVGSDPKQIRDIVNNITAPNANADVKLGAYSTVIPIDATVRVAQAVAVAGHSSASVAQDIEFGLVSGPSESRPTVNLQAGAVGTYPTGWRNARGTMVYDPSVASSDQPVLRLGKRTGSTVAHLCCLMGLYIEYEPSLATGQKFLAVA